MDDELKVVVTSVLEADETASANRIIAQLPDISRRVNERSRIQIGVELANRNGQNIEQQISRELSRVARHTVGVHVNIDTGAIDKFRSELSRLGVDNNITRAISAEMDRLGVRIDQISGAWSETADEEKQLLNLTIQGTDQLGRRISIAKQFTYVEQEGTEELKEQSSTITRITSDLEKQRRIADAAAKTDARNNEKRLNDVIKYEAEIQRLQAIYTGEKGVKPLTNADNITAVKEKYAEVEAAIESLRNKHGAATEEEKRNISSQIASLELLIQKYQNAEYVATKLRTKTVVEVNNEQAQNLTEYETKLRNAGILTQDFAEKIGQLRTQLSTAFDRDTLTAYLNEFDRLQGSVSSFQESIRGVNKTYTELIRVSKEIGAINREMVGLSPVNDSERIAALQNELALYTEQKTALEGQLNEHREILQYASQRITYEQTQKELEAQLATQEARLADEAAKIDVAMRGIPTTVDAIRARFNQLTQPTAELTQQVRSLDTLMNAVASADTEQKKIDAYRKLAETIQFCQREVQNLSVAQRSDLQNFKFGENLEKAKADLATIARTWSAFKRDPGLDGQFRQLEISLQRINNQADLSKWTAEFNRFKSEVRAAGKNVMSLGDILKNNLGKVMQWVSATTLLFRAFRLLKSAVSTVVELDTAMVDLRKVTDATAEGYDRFYHSANETAKRLNATTEAVISQTAEWARLGLNEKIVPPYGDIWVNSWLKTGKTLRRATPWVRNRIVRIIWQQQNKWVRY